MGELDSEYRPPEIELSQMPHQKLMRAFQAAGHPLSAEFDAQLNEHKKKTNFCKTTEKIKQFVQTENFDPRYIAHFFDVTKDQLDNAKTSKDIVPPEVFKKVYESLDSEAARIFIAFLAEIIYRKHIVGEEQNPLVLKPGFKDVGVCADAEIFFAKYKGYEFDWDANHVDVVVDNAEPIAIVKRGANFGNSFSTLTLKPVSINSVTIPPGSILGAEYDVVYNEMPDQSGIIVPAKDAGFQFLRFSQFAFPKDERPLMSAHDYESFKRFAPRNAVDIDAIDILTIEDFKNTALRHLNS